MLNEFATLDASAQAGLVKRGEISPIELAESAIARIEHVNPQFNAIITPLFAQARAQAVVPDLPRDPFRGVPLLLKDFGCQIAATPYYEGMRFVVRSDLFDHNSFFDCSKAGRMLAWRHED
ncbi:MAG: hypothetical protein LC737_03820 [Chloroflexi bacterium]|nr:hypothetical protein [Chloroflexota bacterium]